jgi:hypothetical protein
MLPGGVRVPDSIDAARVFRAAMGMIANRCEALLSAFLRGSVHRLATAFRRSTGRGIVTMHVPPV